jgi:hypothetical protein
MTKVTDHLTEALRAEMNSIIVSYPDIISPVERPINGTAFFPGGPGLWMPKRGELPNFPHGKIMILGQDFGTKEFFEVSWQRNEEDLTQYTWGNLLKLLYRVSVRPEDCFFTNVYMGLRKEGKNTDDYVAAKDKSYTKLCEQFFVKQLELQKPSLIFALGKPVFAFLTALNTDLLKWNKKTFKQIDIAGAIVGPTAFKGIDNYSTTVVALLHPCLRHSNLRWRCNPDGVDDPEIPLIQEALRRSSYPNASP